MRLYDSAPNARWSRTGTRRPPVESEAEAVETGCEPASVAWAVCYKILFFASAWNSLWIYQRSTNAFESTILQRIISYRAEPLGKFSRMKEKQTGGYFTDKAAAYTTATGSYRQWGTEVNLKPPRCGQHKFKDHAQVMQYYEALQYTLFETGRPETVDRTATPRVHYREHDLTITMLSSPVECMAFLLEGAKQCPGDMLLVLSLNWVTKEPSRTHPGLYSLLVHKAITWDSGCRTYIDEFVPPRTTTYLVNFFTKAVTDGQEGGGEYIEPLLDCAMSSSMKLSLITDNKLFTRILLADKGVDYPETLAFPYKTSLKYKPGDHSIIIAQLDSNDALDLDTLLMQKLQEFKALDTVQNFDKLVVKPSGVRWHGSMGVSFHPIEDEVGTLLAMKNLLVQLEPGDALLVETFYPTFTPIHPLIMGDKATPANPVLDDSDLGFRMRATVCRTPEDRPVVTAIICGVGLAKNPINGDNTTPQGLDTTLYEWGVVDPTERRVLHQMVREKAMLTMQAIMEYEETLTADERGNLGAQTDIVGIDFMLTRKRGTLWPVVIEVNSHDCTINCQIYEFINSELQGLSLGPLIQTMIFRSQRRLLAGKKILVIGAGGASKRFIWEAAQEFQIKVILVDPDPDHFAKNMVDAFIPYDISDHTKDEDHCKNIINILKEKQIDPDGCTSFWEDCIVLSALICEELELVGNPPAAVKVAKMKSRTQQVLMTRTADIPHWPRTYLYAVKTFHIENHDDISNAASNIDFPAVMKLEFGSSAVGVKLVNDEEECHAHYDDIQKNLKSEEDHPGIGLGYNNSMLLQEFIDGTEHDIDVIISRRKLVAAVVSDNGPTRVPWFTETAAAMPTYLRPDKKNQLIAAAYQCCIEIGLTDGVFNVEMKMTPRGPKLIEINARMGGFYLRDWVRTVYNVDILFCNFVIAADIKMLLKPLSSLGHMAGVMLVPSQHREMLKSCASLQNLKRLHNEDVIRLNLLDTEDTLDEDTKFEEPFCNIAVFAPTPHLAKEKLLSICQTLGLSTESYPISFYLANFVDTINPRFTQMTHVLS